MISVHFAWHSLFTKFLTDMGRKQALAYILFTGISLNKARHRFKFGQSKTPLTNTWQLSSVTLPCPTLCDPMNCSTPGLPVHHQLLEFTQTHVHWVSDANQPSRTLSSDSPSFTFPASGSFLMSWLCTSGGQSIGASASASVLPMNIQDWSPLGLTGWLLAVQGTLKSLLQHHSSKASILGHSAFFIVQLSHPYMTTGKTIALTSWTFVGKVMSMLFNILSRFVIAFLPRSKCLLILWLQSPSALILEPKKMKSVTVSIVFSSIYHKSNGTGYHDLSFLNVEL